MAKAILAAMNEEIDALRPLVAQAVVSTRAGRDFVRGKLFGHDVVVVFSRWGKVAAASTATELIVVHRIEQLVMLGIAGSVSDLAVGDIVVADSCVQHDLDARPFFPRTVVPLLGERAIRTDRMLTDQLEAAARNAAQSADGWLAPALRSASRVTEPRVVRGCIASGDQVISSAAQRARVLDATPRACCVDMETAAVAQVAYEHGVPFACARVISDGADESIAHSVAPFLGGLAAAYSVAIVRAWLKQGQ